MPTQPSETTQDEALDKVMSFVTTTETMNDDRHQLFVRLDELYTFKDRQVEIEPWLSNLQITGAFEFVERPFAALVANTPAFELTAINKNQPMLELEPQVIDDKALGGDGFTELKPSLRVPWKEVYESDLQQMWQVTKMKRTLRKLTKGGLIFGTYFAEVRQEIIETDVFEPLIETETETEIEDGAETEEAETTEETVSLQTIVEKITPSVELIDVFDVLSSPFANTPEEAIDRFGGFGVIRNYVTLQDLNDDVYFNIDEVEKTLDDSGNTPQLSEKREKQQRVSGNSSGQGGPGTFELIEVWMKFSPTDDFADEKIYIIGVANRATVVRFEEVEALDEQPFSIFKDQEVPGQLWGIGEIEPIVADLYEENTIKNQRIDFNNRLLNEEWLIRSDSGVDPSQLVSKPHNIIVGDDISDSALRMVQRSTAALAVSGEDIDRIRRDMVSTTGSIAIEAGGTEGGLTNTATGEIIRERTAVARYAAKTENLEFAVSDISRKMLRIKARSVSDGEMVPVFIRGKWREIRGSLYKKFIDNYQIGVRAGSMNVQSAITERNNAIAIVNIAKQAAADGLGADVEEAYRALFATFPNIDINKVLPRKLPDSLGSGAPPPAEGGPQGTPLPQEINQLPGLAPTQQLGQGIAPAPSIDKL